MSLATRLTSFAQAVAAEISTRAKFRATNGGASGNHVSAASQVLAFSSAGTDSNPLIITTTIPFGDLMTSVRIKGYQYGPGSDIDLTVGFYAYSAGPQFVNYEAILHGNVDITQVRLMRNASNLVVIVLDKATAWSYPKIEVDVVIGHAPATDAYLKGWTAAVTTTTGLTAMTTVPVTSNYQPLDSDLTAIAALATTSFGRSLLTQADATALRAVLSMAAIATSGSASDLTSGTVPDARLAARLQASVANQVADANAMTSSGFYFGGSTNGPFGAGVPGFILAVANATGGPATLQIATPYNSTSIWYRTSAAGNASWTAWQEVRSKSANDAAYQPLDSDLTAIAALATQSFGRSLLTQVDAPSALSAIGAQPLDGDLTAIAALATQAFGRSLLTQANAGAARNTLGSVNAGVPYTFSSTTTMADPGSGLYRVNGVGTVTIAISEYDGNGLYAGNWLDALAPGSVITLANPSENGDYQVFRITAVTDQGAWRQLSATALIDSVVSLTNGSTTFFTVNGLGSVVPDTGWLPLTLQTGWTWYGSIYEQPSIRKIGSIVYLRGLLSRGASATNNVATIPVGYQPSGTGYGVTHHINAQQGQWGIVNLDTQTSPALLKYNAGGAASSGSWMSLAGVSWLVDDTSVNIPVGAAGSIVRAVNANSVGASANVWTQNIDLTIENQRGTGVSCSSGVMTVQNAGWYRISMNVQFATTPSRGIYRIVSGTNPDANIYISEEGGGGVEFPAMNGSTTAYLPAGTQLRMYSYATAAYSVINRSFVVEAIPDLTAQVGYQDIDWTTLANASGIVGTTQYCRRAGTVYIEMAGVAASGGGALASGTALTAALPSGCIPTRQVIRPAVQSAGTQRGVYINGGTDGIVRVDFGFGAGASGFGGFSFPV